jgi:hypothetical protein
MLIMTAGLWCMVHGLKNRQATLEVGSLLLVASGWVRVLGIPLALAAAAGLLFQPGRLARSRVACNAALLVGGALITGGWLYQHDRAVQASPFPPASYENTLSKLAEGSLAGRFGKPVVHFFDSSRPLSELLTGQELPALCAFPLLWVPIAAGAAYSFRRKHFLLFFATVGYLGAILLVEVPIPRYYLPVAPALFLWLAFGLRSVAVTLSHSDCAKRRVPLLAAAVFLLMACNLPKDVRHVHRQHHPGLYRSGKHQDVVSIAGFLRSANRDKGAMRFVMETDAPCVAYLSDTPYLNVPKSLAKQSLPPESIWSTLQQQKVAFVVLSKNSQGGRPFFDVIRKSIPTWPTYQPVYSTNEFQVFRSFNGYQQTGGLGTHDLGQSNS